MSLQDDTLPEDLPKVFLSYSRRDRERATRISDVLRAREFGVYKDTDDILPTEEWKDRLEQLIQEADTIVFLLSPHSATSEVCAWEVDLAASLNKRIAPIVIDDVESADIPEALSRLNYIFCTERDPFEDAIDTLVSALNTDIEWIREHTRLNTLVRRWTLAGKPGHLLLRGQDIADAEAWRDSRPEDAPAVTKAQAGLISSSRGAASRRQRLAIVGSVCGLLLAVGLAAFAFLQREVAIENEARAIESEQLANETRDAAWLNQSAVLTDWAKEATAAGDTATATQLLLAALPDANAAPDRIDAARPLLPDAAEELVKTFFYAQEVRTLADGEGFRETPLEISKVVFSPDGARFLSLSPSGEGSMVRIWRTQDGALLHRVESAGHRISDIAYLPGGAAFMTVFSNHDHIRWDATSGAKLSEHTGCDLSDGRAGLVHEIIFSQNREIYATEGETICLWRTADGTPQHSIKVQSGSQIEGNLAFIGGDGFLIYTRRNEVLAYQLSQDRTLLMHYGTGTLYARISPARDRLVIADTGTGAVAPSQFDPETHVYPSTILIDLRSATQIAVLSENEALTGARFSADGKLILAAQEARIRTWNAQSGELLSSDRGVPMDDRYFAQNDELVRSVQFAGAGNFVAASDYLGMHKIWNARGREVDRFSRPQPSSQGYSRLVFSPRMGSAVETLAGGPAVLWRVGGAAALKPVDAFLRGAGPVALDAETVETIEAYFKRRSESKLQGGDWPNEEEPETSEVRQANGALVAQANRDGVLVSDTQTGDELALIPTDRLSGLPYRHRTVLFSADGAYLVVLSEDFVDVLSTDGFERVLSLMSEDASLNNNPPADYFDAKMHWQFDALIRNFAAREWSPAKDDYAPRFMRMFDDLQALIDHHKAVTPRCLNADQLKRYRLGNAPPRWCITGPGLEEEPDPENWRPKPPYDVPRWRDWLVAYDRDPTVTPPDQ